MSLFRFNRIAHRCEVIGLGNKMERHGTRTHSYGKPYWSLLGAGKPKAGREKKTTLEAAVCIGVHERDSIFEL